MSVSFSKYENVDSNDMIVATILFWRHVSLQERPGFDFTTFSRVRSMDTVGGYELTGNTRGEIEKGEGRGGREGREREGRERGEGEKGEGRERKERGGEGERGEGERRPGQVGWLLSPPNTSTAHSTKYLGPEDHYYTC